MYIIKLLKIKNFRPLKSCVVFLLMCSLFSQVAAAKITLTSIWGDNMVLQQQSNVSFSGKATAGKRVTVIASWNQRKLTTISDSKGRWSINLPTPQAGGPYTIAFSDGEELRLKNILIGEVWFCSGQSNMEMPMKGFRGQPVWGSQTYIVSANPKRAIRLYTVKNAWSTTEREEGIEGHWSETSPEEVANFSAAAYFFGNVLQKSLDVPVGLIHCSWSMSKIEAWMNKESLSNFPEVTLPDVNAKEFGWTAGTPTLLWNAMVNPWKGFPVKGVIWYQGEANSPNPQLYKKLFPALVQQWRDFFHNPEMPFYYVQLAPWQSEGSDKLDWAWFRQCQLELMKEIPHVGMVTTGDIGSETFIHSPHKIKVGERLAYWALAQTYNRKGFQFSGPLYKSFKVKGNVVEIDFEHGEEGLTPENQNVKGFEIVGEDGIFRQARAEIINGSSVVKVWNDSVNHPMEVRYCFRNYMLGELCNNAGLPASPFRIVLQKKPALMWFDAEANFERFSHKDSIDYYLQKIKSLGFTHAIVDIRPITGEVLYKSDLAPQMREWKGVKAGDFDYLGYFIKKGHELGLEVHASLNVFCAGHNYFDRGMVYNGHPEWASMVYTPDKGIIPITEEKQKYGAMINPLNEAYRTHILNVMKEIVTKYPDIDGLMLDRVRYDGISADFSDLSRQQFEAYIKQKIKRFPDDIFTWQKNASGKYIPQPGKYLKKWLEWRTKNITDFMALARQEVKAANPNVSFGTYTGAWYPSYYEVGVNFASNLYDPSADFEWATPDYKNYGYANLIDLYATGNYYTDITLDEYKKTNHSVWNETDSQAQSGTWYCVEGSCRHLRHILKGHPFLGGVLVDQFYNHPSKLSESIEMNLRQSDGLMVFDIVHIISKNLWKEIEEGMRNGGAL